MPSRIPAQTVIHVHVCNAWCTPPIHVNIDYADNRVIDGMTDDELLALWRPVCARDNREVLEVRPDYEAPTPSLDDLWRIGYTGRIADLRCMRVTSRWFSQEEPHAPK